MHETVKPPSRHPSRRRPQPTDPAASTPRERYIDAILADPTGTRRARLERAADFWQGVADQQDSQAAELAAELDLAPEEAKSGLLATLTATRAAAMRAGWNARNAVRSRDASFCTEKWGPRND